MNDSARLHDDRRLTNPAFNGRTLKLGTFQTNLDYGCDWEAVSFALSP